MSACFDLELLSNKNLFRNLWSLALRKDWEPGRSVIGKAGEFPLGAYSGSLQLLIDGTCSAAQKVSLFSWADNILSPWIRDRNGFSADHYSSLCVDFLASCASFITFTSHEYRCSPLHRECFLFSFGGSLYLFINLFEGRILDFGLLLGLLRPRVGWADSRMEVSLCSPCHPFIVVGFGGSALAFQPILRFMLELYFSQHTEVTQEVQWTMLRKCFCTKTLLCNQTEVSSCLHILLQSLSTSHEYYFLSDYKFSKIKENFLATCLLA